MKITPENSGAYHRLMEYQIKPSQQRVAIMAYLMLHRTHPSADEIYRALSPDMPTLSKTTVYNTLKLFNEQGAAQMLTIDERSACFDGDVSHHTHFLCKQCGRIYDMPMREVGDEADRLRREGHVVTETHVYYKGLCKQCLTHVDCTN
ncbi:MAG: Fur family transcriptional regulator [Bacteroidaceae bacterium]